MDDPENSALDSFSLELFEDISYIMAKHADPYQRVGSADDRNRAGYVYEASEG